MPISSAIYVDANPTGDWELDNPSIGGTAPPATLWEAVDAESQTNWLEFERVTNNNREVLELTSIEHAGITSAGLVLPAVAGNYASCPDTAGVSVTGDLDIIVDLDPVDFTPVSNQCLVAKWTESGNERSYALVLNIAGDLDLWISTNGTNELTWTSSTTINTAASVLRATRDESVGDVKFYETVAGSETQLGTTVSGTTGGPYDSDAVLEVGASDIGVTGAAEATIRSVTIKDGYDGAGTAVASPDFEAQVPGTLLFDDALSNTWTVWQSSGALPAGAVVTGIQIEACIERSADSTGQLKVRSGAIDAAGDLVYGPDENWIRGITGVPYLWRSPMRRSLDSGALWDEYTRYGFVVSHASGSDVSGLNGDSFKLYWLRAYVEFLSGPPLPTDLTLSGTISVPTACGWRNQQVDGIPQTHFRCQIFDSPTYNAAGFDPETSTAALFDTGQTAGTETRSVEITEPLPDGTYRQYCKIWNLGFDGGDLESDWAYSEFTINTAPLPPTAPIQVDLQDPINGANALVENGCVQITVSAGNDDAEALLHLQRSDGGLEYVDVVDEYPMVRTPDSLTGDGAHYFAGDAGVAWAEIDGSHDDAVGGSGLIVCEHDGENYWRFADVADDRLSLADHADFDIVGDIDIRVKIGLLDRTADTTLLCKDDSSAGGTSYRLVLESDDKLTLYWSVDGSADLSETSSVVVPGLPTVSGESMWVRATLDVDNGSSDAEVEFEESRDDETTWVQIGSTQLVGATTSIHSSATDIWLGDFEGAAGQEALGEIYRWKVYNGIDGTLVLDVAGDDITTDDGGEASTFTASVGGTGTVTVTRTNPTTGARLEFIHRPTVLTLGTHAVNDAAVLPVTAFPNVSQTSGQATIIWCGRARGAAVDATTDRQMLAWGTEFDEGIAVYQGADHAGVRFGDTSANVDDIESNVLEARDDIRCWVFSIDDGEVTVYGDGVAKNTETITGLAGVLPALTVGSIGNEADQDTTTVAWVGQMFEAIVYDGVALGDAAAASIINSLKTGPLVAAEYQAIVSDPHCVFETDLVYRARLKSGDLDSVSTWTVAAAFSNPVDRWWFVDYVDKTLGFAPKVIDYTVSDQRSTVAIFSGAPNSTGSVASSGSLGRRISLTVRTETKAERLEFEAFMATGRKFRIVDILGRAYWVKLVSDIGEDMIRAMPLGIESTNLRDYHEFSFEVVQVEAPPV